MARQSHTVQGPPVWKDGTLASNGDETVFTLVAADATNFESCAFTARETLIVFNSDDTNPYTFTIEGVPDNLGRTANLGPITVEALEIHRVELDSFEGFRQSDGKLYFKGSNAAIKFAVYRPKT